jgi:ATP-dependent helicase YprA (DUF1998 family)
MQITMAVKKRTRPDTNRPACRCPGAFSSGDGGLVSRRLRAAHRPAAARLAGDRARRNTLILAPTGTGKTLTAFLWCLDRLMLHRAATETEGCRVIYLSPLKALAVDVERNLRSPLAGIANMARQAGVPFHQPEISIRTGDTSQKDRAGSGGIRPRS